MRWTAAEEALRRLRLLRPSFRPFVLLTAVTCLPGCQPQWPSVLAAEEAPRWLPYLQLALCREPDYTNAGNIDALAATQSMRMRIRCFLRMSYSHVLSNLSLSLRPNGNCAVVSSSVAGSRSPLATCRLALAASPEAAACMLHVEGCTTFAAGL